MIPLLVFVAAAALLYFAVVESAFGLLMRLPRRLEAERERAHDALGAYLNDPITFFVPARLMRGTVLIVVVILLAQPIGTGLVPAFVLLGCGLALYVAVGQVLPAILVRRSPERVLDFFLPSFTAIANIAAPVTSLIIAWLGPVERTEESAAAPATLPAAADPADPATPRGEETRLLRSVVDFGETLVREVMTPRPDIVAIRESATIAELRALFREQEYSRFPAYKESLDNIAGFVFVKDLILLDTADDSRSIATLLRPAAVVPETKRVPELLKQFQRQQTQCAIVVDEYGGTAGLVTIEDLLEEIVGEIRDEYDEESEPIVEEGNGKFVFSAKVDIDEVVQRLNVPIEREGFETVGGYLLSHIGRVPAVGEQFDIDGLSVEVLDVERRRINKVRIFKPEVPETAGEKTV